jgi:ABC-2 type transport system permease protein
MGTVFKLYATQLKVRLGVSVLKYNIKAKKMNLFKTIGFILLMLLVGIELIGGYSFLCYKLFGVTTLIKHPEIIISLAYVGSQIVTLIFGLFFILGIMFFAKDSEFLSSLPLPQWQVFSSKFLLVYTNEIILTLAITAPPVIIYGIGTSSGVFFYLKAFLILLFLPFLPLAIASLLSMLLMGAVSKTKHRDAISIVAGLFFIVAVIVGQNLFVSQMPSAGISQSIAALLQSSDGLIKLIGRYFPPSIWAALGVTSQSDSLFNIAAFVLVSLAALIIIIFISSKIYYAGALSQLETVKRQRSNSRKRFSFETGSPLMAIFMREWKLLIRTPIYALNSLTTVILGPLVILLPAFSSRTAIDPLLKQLTDLTNAGSGMYVIFGLALAGVIFAAINPAASTIYSREGKTFWISKTIPITPRQQVTAKLLSAFSLSAATAILTIIAAAICYGISVYLAVGAIVLSLIVSFALAAVNVIVDLIHPKLNWNSQQEAIKQNLNVLIGIGAELLIIVPIVGIVLLFSMLNAPPILNGAVVLLFSIIAVVVLYRVLINISDWAYSRIEQ